SASRDAIRHVPERHASGSVARHEPRPGPHEAPHRGLVPAESLDDSTAVAIVETDGVVEAGARDQTASRRDGHAAERTGTRRSRLHGPGPDVPGPKTAVPPDGEKPLPIQGEVLDATPPIHQQAPRSPAHEVEERDLPELAADRRDPPVRCEGCARAFSLD